MTIEADLACPYKTGPGHEQFIRFREKHGWSKRDVAFLLGVTEAAVSHWESGKNVMKAGLWELLHIKAIVQHRRKVFKT
jgi:predicted transcriptional regulator